MTGRQSDPSHMENVRARLVALEDSQRSIAASLQSLVRLEERHAETRAALDRAFGAIADQGLRLEAMTDSLRQRIGLVDDQVPDNLGPRLQKLEERAPLWNLTSGWVMAFTIGCALLLLGAVGKDYLDRVKGERPPVQAQRMDAPRG